MQSAHEVAIKQAIKMMNTGSHTDKASATAVYTQVHQEVGNDMPCLVWHGGNHGDRPPEGCPFIAGRLMAEKQGFRWP